MTVRLRWRHKCVTEKSALVAAAAQYFALLALRSASTLSTRNPRIMKPIAAHHCRMDRRSFLALGTAAISGAALLPGISDADEESRTEQITRYPDPSVVVLDPRFAKYKIGNAAIQRLWTGAFWAEWCAWNG